MGKEAEARGGTKREEAPAIGDNAVEKGTTRESLVSQPWPQAHHHHKKKQHVLKLSKDDVQADMEARKSPYMHQFQTTRAMEEAQQVEQLDQLHELQQHQGPSH